MIFTFEMITQSLKILNEFMELSLKSILSFGESFSGNFIKFHL